MSLDAAPAPPSPPENRPPSFLSRVGTVALTIVRHVPTRGASWGAFALVLGIVLALLVPFVARLSYGTRADALATWPFVSVRVLLVLAGSALFVVHGLHRGVARAALDLEQRFGLVAYVVDRILLKLHAKIGGPISNLPLARFERLLKTTLDDYLGSDDMREGRGLTGWVVRAAKRAIVRRVETYLLAAYRAEERPDGTGGGVSLERVRERATAELSSRLGTLVMAPLNKQLALFIALVTVVPLFWFHAFQLVLGLFGRS
jgi:hypothetical protein